MRAAKFVRGAINPNHSLPIGAVVSMSSGGHYRVVAYSGVGAVVLRRLGWFEVLLTRIRSLLP